MSNDIQSNDINDKNKWEKTLDSYKIVLDIFKLNNDNYFKRVQVFMSALQIGIAYVFVKVIPTFPKLSNLFGDLNIFWSLVGRLFAAAIFAVLGGILALVWRGLGRRQSQYLEFNRRYLRNLEGKLNHIGIPLDYFNLESNVFRPLSDDSKKIIKCYATACIFNHPETGHNYAEFNWIPEQYPEISDNADKLHEIGKVKGGMVRVESKLLLLLAILWFVLASLFFITWVGLLVYKYTKGTVMISIWWIIVPCLTIFFTTLGGIAIARWLPQKLRKTSIIKEIKQLAKLKKKGILSESEFEEKKKELLARM